MKLSYRDKVIFICAIVIIILVAGFFLFIKPKYDEMTVAKSYLADKETEKAGIEERINTLPQLVESIKEVAKTVEEPQKRFVMYQDPYLNEQLVYEVLEANDVEITSMNTQYLIADQASGYVVNNKNITTYDFLMQGDLYEELPEDVRNHYNNLGYQIGEVFQLGMTSMDVVYKDDVDLANVIAFLDDMAEDERTIRVNTFTKNFDTKDNEDGTGGTLNVQIYHLFPLNVEKVLEETDQVEIVPVAEEAAAE